MQTEAAATQTALPHRLSAQAGEVIDRSTTITFTFDGREYTAHPGDTLASALAAAGVKVFSRSFKYHRPRGLMCCAGHCPNCLVQVGDEPNVRACQRPVEAGLEVRPQNAWPSLAVDLMSLTQLGDRFLPVGFYYKTFIRPKRLWPLYETVLRRAAGLGEVSPEAAPDAPSAHSQQFLHTDVVVIGGGPAGMSAALAAAERGARVTLFDENPALGGHLRFAGGEAAAAWRELQSSVERQPNLTVHTNTTILGWYLNDWLSAVSGSRLFKIRARAIVVATGAYEMPLVFDNNDLPGVMLGSAVQRLLHLYGVRPGRRAVVVTANDDGWAVAVDLRAAGARVVAVADERQRDDCASPHVDMLGPETKVFWQHTLLAAQGSGAVNGAVIARTNGEMEVDASAAQSFDCDLIVVSVGWTPALDIAHQAGGKAAYDVSRSEILPTTLPPGLFVIGRAAGTHAVGAQVVEGRAAGEGAAAFLGRGGAPTAEAQADLAKRRAAAPRRTSPRVIVRGHKKRIVCFCEDVTDKDIQTAIAEGYDSLELLKRYSTVTMGPCQGKMCALNSIHLCARVNGWSVQETGTTTSRQPTTPVSLASLAGQHMEPAQVTPAHVWHAARGAKMMLAGLWIRPLHYGEAAAEVKAVRERVGLIDVSTLGKMRFTGPGVPALLDRLYINQFKNLGLGRVRYGVMCNDEGVVLDDGVSARLAENEWYMTTTTSGAGAMFETMQWWMQSGWGEGSHLTDLTEAYAAFNLAGPKSRAVLQKLYRRPGGASLPDDVSNEAFPYMHIRVAEVAGVPCRIMRIGFTGELSYEIHAPSAYGLHVWEALMEAGQVFGILPFGLEAQRVLRLEKAHIIVSQDTDAVTDPLSADLGWAVKLDKPDFLGKRALVRISAEGPKQKLVGFKMARPGIVPDEGVQIVRTGVNGKMEILGYVTSARHSPTLGETIGLCWLSAGLAAQNGASFTIRLLNGSSFEEAKVHHGPFYDPKGERLRM